MNTTVTSPEVQEFLAAVRGQLADLDPEEQSEIIDGLEADLTDLVAERGGEALGDPVAYARELRAAAGIDEVIVPHTRPIRASVDGFLDACHARFDTLVGRVPGDAAPLFAWLRPLWWVARAWLAVELFDLLFGRGQYAGDVQLVPDLRGWGWALLIGAAIASIQLGRGKVWPGGSRGLSARLVLLALNVAALILAPLVLVQMEGENEAYSEGWNLGYQTGLREMRDANTEQAGIYVDGTWVSNIYPYDAQGRPLVGVQLFDQVGEPINVVTQPEYDPGVACIPEDTECVSEEVALDAEGNQMPRVFYPWTNGATQLLNVFPIPSRLQEGEEPSPTAFTEAVEPTVGPLPLASVPKVSLPGIEASKQKPATP